MGLKTLRCEMADLRASQNIIGMSPTSITSQATDR
jgi:hypothetical protein